MVRLASGLKPALRGDGGLKILKSSARPPQRLRPPGPRCPFEESPKGHNIRKHPHCVSYEAWA
jgi:hypothetical protein